MSLKKYLNKFDRTVFYSALIIIFALIPFLTSLNQIAYIKDYTADANVEYGIGLLLVGWINLFGAGISWLANPLLFVAWLCLIRSYNKGALIFSLLSILFSLSFLLFDQILANEAGDYCKILERGLGYWLWLLSCIITFLGSVIVYAFKRNGS